MDVQMHSTVYVCECVISFGKFNGRRIGHTAIRSLINTKVGKDRNSAGCFGRTKSCCGKRCEESLTAEIVLNIGTAADCFEDRRSAISTVDNLNCLEEVNQSVEYTRGWDFCVESCSCQEEITRL